MRLLLAFFSHETNTFSSPPTPLDAFLSPNVPHQGKEAIDFYRGKSLCLSGLIDAAEEAEAEIVLSVAAGASPGGIVEAAAFEVVMEKLLAPLRTDHFDGILLALHGAMVTETFDDGESEILRRVRALAPDTPIGVALDMHANLYAETVRLATVVTGYHTYPHADMRETAQLAGRITIQAIRKEIRPVMAYGRLPLLSHMLRQGSFAAPNKQLQEAAAALERNGDVLAASILVGFPYSDIEGAGLSVVVVVDGDEAKAQTILDSLLTEAWSQRENFVFPVEPLEEALERASTLPADKGPVLLLEHSDQPGSGGSVDTTLLLGKLIEGNFEDTIYLGIFDPTAVEDAIAAGVGETVTLNLGGRHHLPNVAGENSPLQVTGFVKTISSGKPSAHGTGYFGLKSSLGKTVVLQVGGIDIVILSRRAEAMTPDMFTILGLDPRHRRFLALKGRVNWRIGLEGIPSAVVECEANGASPSDYGKLRFEKLRRPIYPLDSDAAFSL